jgi:hypothetical protein
MKSTSHPSCTATILLAASVMALSACSKPDPAKSASKPAPVAAGAQTPAPQMRASSALGDLSAFRTIALEVAGIVEKGDLPAAKARSRDLELAWDAEEAGLKQRATSDWHVVDNAIDRALKSLRADEPSVEDCKQAMASLLMTFDDMGTPSATTRYLRIPLQCSRLVIEGPHEEWSCTP